MGGTDARAQRSSSVIIPKRQVTRIREPAASLFVFVNENTGKRGHAIGVTRCASATRRLIGLSVDLNEKFFGFYGRWH